MDEADSVRTGNMQVWAVPVTHAHSPLLRPEPRNHLRPPGCLAARTGSKAARNVSARPVIAASERAEFICRTHRWSSPRGPRRHQGALRDDYPERAFWEGLSQALTVYADALRTRRRLHADAAVAKLASRYFSRL